MLLMRYPEGGWGQGRRVDALISNLDILPTLLESCGLGIPDRVQGHSFLSLLEGAEVQPKEPVYGEKTFHDCYDPMRCVRTRLGR